MEEVYYWIRIVAFAGSIVLSIASFTIAMLGRVRKAKAEGKPMTGGEIVSIAAGALSELIENDLPEFIAEAEAENGLSGAIKKVIVMSKTALRCAELGIDYQANAATLGEAVDKLVAFSKKVNVGQIIVK